MNAVLYARVSTEEQAKKFSLNQQIQALRDHCFGNGIEVLEEVRDEGYSGAYLERPGLDTVRDLVETSKPDLVLVQDRDRLSREPAYYFILSEEFKTHGTQAVALNQHGDDSPEGQLADGIMDQLGKFERMKFAERTRRGRLRKAREGKIVGTGKPNYGFTFVNDRYEVNPAEMIGASKIFHWLANGKSVYQVTEALDEIGIRSPKGKRWHRASIRPFVMNDVYRPHRVSEFASHVSPELLDRLDPEKMYGVYWYNRVRTDTRKVVKVVDGERVYRRKTNNSERPKEEWIAIPVPDSGIPKEIVDKARENIKDNVYRVSKNGDRFWELSGGVAFCAECGNRMSTISIPTKKTIHHYYRCQNTHLGEGCPNRKYRRASDLDQKAISVLQDLYSDHSKIKALVRESFDRKIKEAERRNPHLEARMVSERVQKLRENLSNAQDLAIDGLLTKEELVTKTAKINDELRSLEDRMGRLDSMTENIEALERKKETILDLQETGVAWDLGLIEDEGDGWIAEGAKSRHKLYKSLGIKVKVDRENVFLEMDGTNLLAEPSVLPQARPV